MNTILQKRIEDAANMTVQNLYDYAKQTRNPKVSAYSEGYLDAIDIQGEFLFKEGANYALSNQWISVEEALPEYDEDVFVRFISRFSNNTDEFEVGYCIRWRTLDESIKTDSKGFSIIGNMEITHWMLIPSLEGGEE